MAVTSNKAEELLPLSARHISVHCAHQTDTIRHGSDVAKHNDSQVFGDARKMDGNSQEHPLHSRWSLWVGPNEEIDSNSVGPNDVDPSNRYKSNSCDSEPRREEGWDFDTVESFWRRYRRDASMLRGVCVGQDTCVCVLRASHFPRCVHTASWRK
eukprot:GHVR01093227.1.p1 GENE.GHVR01093227.1~~GHVR01093227.1.p1  ORF type:complete len:155 (-),score=32.15 GHVR01093227.1:95-559(-)